MGTDNLFHKRKAKKAEELGRSNAKRAPYERVLIVCEGEKTEPYYFNGLIEYYGLSSANVEVTGDCGSDPLSIVSHAKDRYDDEQRAPSTLILQFGGTVICCANYWMAPVFINGIGKIMPAFR